MKWKNRAWLTCGLTKAEPHSILDVWGRGWSRCGSQPIICRRRHVFVGKTLLSLVMPMLSEKFIRTVAAKKIWPTSFSALGPLNWPPRSCDSCGAMLRFMCTNTSNPRLTHWKPNTYKNIITYVLTHIKRIIFSFWSMYFKFQDTILTIRKFSFSVHLCQMEMYSRLCVLCIFFENKSLVVAFYLNIGFTSNSSQNNPSKHPIPSDILYQFRP